jgi:hypothetical protein
MKYDFQSSFLSSSPMLYLPESNIPNISLAISLSIGVTVLVYRELSAKTQLAYSKFSKSGIESNSLKVTCKKKKKKARKRR